MAATAAVLQPTDSPAPDVHAALYHALDAESRPLVGPAARRLVVIPLRDDAGRVAGGLWGATQFRWLHIEMLLVPACLRGRGIGSALLASAEQAARDQGCIGIHLDTFSFQAEPFYRSRGFTRFGVLPNFPPNHDRVYLSKTFLVPA
jgi:GNAT superfamily N-acetyltransferase